MSEETQGNFWTGAEGHEVPTLNLVPKATNEQEIIAKKVHDILEEKSGIDFKTEIRTISNEVFGVKLSKEGISGRAIQAMCLSWFKDRIYGFIRNDFTQEVELEFRAYSNLGYLNKTCTNVQGQPVTYYD